MREVRGVAKDESRAVLSEEVRTRTTRRPPSTLEPTRQTTSLSVHSTPVCAARSLHAPPSTAAAPKTYREAGALRGDVPARRSLWHAPHDGGHARRNILVPAGGWVQRDTRMRDVAVRGAVAWGERELASGQCAAGAYLRSRARPDAAQRKRRRRCGHWTQHGGPRLRALHLSLAEARHVVPRAVHRPK